MKGRALMPYEPTSWDDLKRKPELYELFMKIICAKIEEESQTKIPEVCSVLEKAIKEVKPYLIKTNNNTKTDSEYSKIYEAVMKLMEAHEALQATDSVELKAIADKFAEMEAIKAKKEFLNGKVGDDLLLAKACWDFAEYQLNAPNMWEGSKTSFKKDGFQIGSPWHGDVLKAPVLFLSSNPNIKKDCIFPRWHVNENPEFTLDGKSINPEGIYEFLRDRLKIRINDKGNPCALKKSEGKEESYEVPYWRGLRMIMEAIASEFEIGENDDEDRIERLMRSVLSAEIIFFGSKNETYTQDSDRLCYFWNKFITPLLKNCAAKVIILVGNKAKDTFKMVNTNRGFPPRFSNHTYYWNASDIGKSFLVLRTKHLSRNFDEGDENDEGDSQEIVKLLKKAQDKNREVKDKNNKIIIDSKKRDDSKKIIRAKTALTKATRILTIIDETIADLRSNYEV